MHVELQTSPPLSGSLAEYLKPKPFLTLALIIPSRRLGAQGSESSARSPKAPCAEAQTTKLPAK